MSLKFLRKKRYIILLGIILIVFISLFYLSTFTKMWIEKNSLKLIGRKIEMKELHFNYFMASVRAQEVKIYETNKADKFISIGELYINFEPLKLITGEIKFSEIRIVKPSVNIIYSKSGFNFDDILKMFESGEEKPQKEKGKTDNTKYVINNLSIKDGFVKYEDLTSKSQQEIKNLNINIPNISWNSNQSKLGIDFALGEKGKVFISGLIDQEKIKYLLKLKTQDIEISPFTNYFKSYLDVNPIGGKLFSDLQISGDMSKPQDITVKGEASIKFLSLKDKNDKEVFSAENIKADFESIDIGRSDYKISNLVLESPILVAVRNKDKTNIEQMLAPYFADTAKSEDTTKLRYSVKNMQINSGHVLFSDLTLNRKFNLNLLILNVTMGNFSESSDSIPITFKMKEFRDQSSFDGKITLSMLNSKKIDFNGNVRNLELLIFSPYSEYYLSRPLTKGIFNYSCNLRMTPEKLDNLNKIKVINPKFGKKTKDSLRYRVPVNLALYILKDSKGIVNIELPVEGKPSDPSFKLRKLMWRTLENFLLKTITQPFVAIGNTVGTNPNSIKTIPFALLQDSLSDEQKHRLDKLSEIMLSKPDLVFTFTQTTDPDKEIELFAMLGSDNVNQLFSQLLEKRNKLISDYLQTKGIPPKSLVVKTADLKNLPEELKIPQFTIDISMP